MKRGEIWWADLGAYRPREQTGRRPVVIWQSDTLTRALQSVLVVPLTTNLDRARLAGTAMIEASCATVSAISQKTSLVNWSWQPMKHWDA